MTFSMCSLYTCGAVRECHSLKQHDLVAVMTSYLLEVCRQLVGGEKRGLGAPVDLIEHADHEQRDDEADHQRAQEVQKDEPPGSHTCPAAQTQIRVVDLDCASSA